jgi:alkanesulfonate monooxygenase SsuD/methylene tetrahydromethanopterin reductase-like flavin-dependent oxidoreductase (luciferase family)
VADHLMLGKDEAILEGWTVLSALAGATTRPKLGMIHMAHYFRHPSLTAKMTATLDQISGGRLIHFLDCGYQRREYVNYGLPWRDEMEDRIVDLVEATELILRLWAAEEPVTVKGRTWEVTAAICAPKPLQQPHPPLWFGEAAPGGLAACARYGQGWNTTPVPVQELRRRVGLLEHACNAAGRDMAEIELSLETQVLIAPDIAALRDRLRTLLQPLHALVHGRAGPSGDGAVCARCHAALLVSGAEQAVIPAHSRRASATATMMIAPRMMICWLLSSPIRMSPLLTTPISSAPSTEPRTEPEPPKRLVPPRTTAAITESSSPSPHWKRPDCRRPA